MIYPCKKTKTEINHYQFVTKKKVNIDKYTKKYINTLGANRQTFWWGLLKVALYFFSINYTSLVQNTKFSIGETSQKFGKGEDYPHIHSPPRFSLMIHAINRLTHFLTFSLKWLLIYSIHKLLWLILFIR